MSVLVLVEVKVNPGRREELRTLLQGNMHEITAAEGCPWRIHTITRQSVFGTTHDSASSIDTKPRLSAGLVR